MCALPCSFRRSERFSSTSGRSAFSTSLRHWLWRLLRVTVKFTNVTREHKSGGNSTCVNTRGGARQPADASAASEDSLGVGPLSYRRVSCGEEDHKRRRQIDVLVSQGDEDAASGSAHLSVQHRVQDWVVALHILETDAADSGGLIWVLWCLTRG